MADLNKFFEEIITVKWSQQGCYPNILDQSLLPQRIERLELKTPQEVWEAIHGLKVRGAPAIGVCAAMALASQAQFIEAQNFPEFLQRFTEIKEYFASARPTAVNLFWALARMYNFALTRQDLRLAELKAGLLAEAENIRQEDIAISRGIGQQGVALLKQLKKSRKTLNILTHCNAGTLATAKYGTATAPLYLALEAGFSQDDFHVYCDETRPLLQGARLTSFELFHAGFPTTVITDSMSSVLMAQGLVDLVFIGCDRVAANGDSANKIGSCNLAIVAQHYGVPFYVCAPSSTLDPACPDGASIPIEMRAGSEISEKWYKEPMVYPGIDLYNPAFDVTPWQLITGIISEDKIYRAPYDFRPED